MYRFILSAKARAACLASVLGVSVFAMSVFAMSVFAGSTATAQSDRRGPPTWGAIAYNSATAAYGVAYNYRSRNAAQKAALKHCKQALCRSLVSFRGGCAAVAAERRVVQQFGSKKVTYRYTGTYGYGRAPTKQVAINRAITECQKRSVEFCRMRVWVCTRS